VTADRISSPQDAASWLEFVNSLCAFAYICGMEFARLGGPKEPPFFIELQTSLAWEAGWDDFQKSTT